MILILRKAWLLAGTLAVIAGLLGMHVLTAGHTAVAHSAVGDHAPATCSDSCPGAQEAGVPCVPSVPGAPVTVAPPQATLAALLRLPTANSPGPAYGYVPPSPTPCDLSISRT
jgi:hypothetical protein